MKTVGLVNKSTSLLRFKIELKTVLDRSDVKKKVEKEFRN